MVTIIKNHDGFYQVKRAENEAAVYYSTSVYETVDDAMQLARFWSDFHILWLVV